MAVITGSVAGPTPGFVSILVLLRPALLSTLFGSLLFILLSGKCAARAAHRAFRFNSSGASALWGFRFNRFCFRLPCLTLCQSPEGPSSSRRYASSRFSVTPFANSGQKSRRAAGGYFACRCSLLAIMAFNSGAIPKSATIQRFQSSSRRGECAQTQTRSFTPGFLLAIYPARHTLCKTQGIKCAGPVEHRCSRLARLLLNSRARAAPAVHASEFLAFLSLRTTRVPSRLLQNSSNNRAGREVLSVFRGFGLWRYGARGYASA